MKKVLNAFWTELRHFGYSARLSERGWLDSPTLISWKKNFKPPRGYVGCYYAEHPHIFLARKVVVTRIWILDLS